MDAIEKIAGISVSPSYQRGMLDAKCRVNVEESSGLTPADAAACSQNKFSRYLPDSDVIGDLRRNTWGYWDRALRKFLSLLPTV